MSKPINSRTVAAGAIGNVLEWYDFSVYGFLAPVLAAQFFPTGDPLTSLIAAFGVFAAGYLMRPIGGMVIGHIGDRIGRRPALILSIVLMAVPTGLIALLPTHASIGVAAAVLLTLLRLLQGFSVGGEYGGLGDLPRRAGADAPPRTGHQRRLRRRIGRRAAWLRGRGTAGEHHVVGSPQRLGVAACPSCPGRSSASSVFFSVAR